MKLYPRQVHLSNNKGKSKVKRIIVGISLIVSSVLVHAASFDCAKASTRIEKAVCGDEQLSKLDSDLMTAYKAAQASSSDTDKLKSEQKAWLQGSRNKCEDTACIRKAYEDRINALKPVEVSTPVTQTVPEAAVAQNESLPDVKQEEKPVEVAAPVVAAEPTPQTQTSEPTTAPKNTPAGEPTSTVADILFGIAGLIGIALIAGLIKPKWVIRWSATPTRLKVIGYLLPVLMIVSVAAPMSRTKERAEYDTKVAEQSRAQREQDEKDRIAAKNAKNASTGSGTSTRPNVSSSNQVQPAAQLSPSAQRFNRSVGNFMRLEKAAAQTAAFSDPYSGCRKIASSAYEKFEGDISNSIAQMAQSRNQDLINASLDSGAMSLDALSGQLSSICGVN